MTELREYVGINGRIFFREWYERLETRTRTRVLNSVARLEQGNFSTVKRVGSGVFEMRLDFGPGYRVYFAKDGEELVLPLGGGTKVRQQADIRTAHDLWAEYKCRKAI